MNRSILLASDPQPVWRIVSNYMRLKKVTNLDLAAALFVNSAPSNLKHNDFYFRRKVSTMKFSKNYL